MASYFKKWRGKEVTDEVKRNVARALGEFGLRAEGHSKRELRKGHGVLTGTLRRSIHTAQPGYDWGGDSGSSEMGGKTVEGAVGGEKVTLELGSGLTYAMAVHQGHHSFEGYHYLTNGLAQAKPELAGVLRKYQL
jgi:hypothetical protein